MAQNNKEIHSLTRRCPSLFTQCLLHSDWTKSGSQLRSRRTNFRHFVVAFSSHQFCCSCIYSLLLIKITVLVKNLFIIVLSVLFLTIVHYVHPILLAVLYFVLLVVKKYVLMLKLRQKVVFLLVYHFI